MSSRKQQREQARAERLAMEQKAAAEQKRKQRLWLLGGVVAMAAVVVVVLVVISGGDSTGGDGDRVEGTADIRAMLAGVPQSGQALGNPKAPVTLVEFADLQCPFCKEFADNVTPRLIQDYVRTNKLRMEFEPLTFIGPDSERAARYALAAGEQNKLWNFVELFYRNQGTENTGYADDDFIAKIGAAAGVNAAQADAAKGSAATTAALAKANALAQRNQVNSTPSFLIGRTGGPLIRFEARALDPKVFADRIEQELQKVQ